MSNVIEVGGLRKEFTRFRKPRTVAVAGLDLEVPQGGVFGFLGPNGSGKTTTIRCLLGLVAPTKGQTRLLGASPSMLPNVIRRVGSLVETPTFFPTFSGRRNLLLLARMYSLPRAHVEGVLERVGLSARGDDLVKTYSLGMKQRLGIAAALLKDPEVLILDEPANGLDPAGIKEVRELLRALGREGRTVFLSSHQLGEVQQVCDRVAILSRGSCIAAGPVAEVLSQGRAARVIARVADPAKGVTVLRAAGFDVTVDQQDGSLRVEADPSDASRISEALAKKRLYVSELRADVADLEDVFLALTGESSST